MNLGWLDVCLRVSNFEVSRAFYEGLGFTLVEGEPENGWGVFVREESRIGLYSEVFMPDDYFALNFRGGCIPEVLQCLETHGIEPIAPPIRIDAQSGSVKFCDPDGYLIFVDSAPDETKRT